ncbi:Hypothetical protein GL50581_1048 [Giardia duodenalis ATCC 50581]|nr:Hypothetical protein GL50581_1048 [Giardia intestinalis ATCC 50581]
MATCDQNLSPPLLSSSVPLSIHTHNSVHDLDAISTPVGLCSSGLLWNPPEHDTVLPEPCPLQSSSGLFHPPHLDPDAMIFYPYDSGVRPVLDIFPQSGSLRAAEEITPPTVGGRYLDPIAKNHLLLEQHLHSIKDKWMETALKVLVGITQETVETSTAIESALTKTLGKEKYSELCTAPLFLLLNVVTAGFWMDDVIPSFPKVLSQEDRTKRFANSIEAIYEGVLRTLEAPATREQLAEKTGFQRRRLSSVMMPLRAIGLIAEPENLKRDHPNSDKAVCEHDGGPNLILCRNARQEAASFTISSFCRYYRQLRLIRQHLERTIGLVRYDNSFIDERLTYLTRPRPSTK